MAYAQFALWFFLFWLTALALYVTHQGTMRGGPFFYTDMRASGQNSIQQKFRVAREKAYKMNHALEVHFDHRGMPWKIKYLVRGREQSRIYYFRDKAGRLRYELGEAPWDSLKPAPAP